MQINVFLLSIGETTNLRRTHDSPYLVCGKYLIVMERDPIVLLLLLQLSEYEVLPSMRAEESLQDEGLESCFMNQDLVVTNSETNCPRKRLAYKCGGHISFDR